MVENPYNALESREEQPVATPLFPGIRADDKTIERRILFAIDVAAVLHPVLLVVGLYSAWLVAYGKLGHAPRTSRDDPSELLGVVYYVSGLPFALLDAGVTAAGFSVLRRFYSVLIGRSRPSALVIALVICALWVASTALLRCDPIGVGDWWID